MRITQKLVGVSVLALMAGCASLNPFASKPKGNQPVPLVELKGSMAVRPRTSCSRPRWPTTP
jgi:outer membrane protein assembly factor BamB